MPTTLYAYLIGGVLIFGTIGGLAVYGKYEHAQAVASKAQVAQLAEINKENVAAVAQLQKANAAAAAAAVKLATERQSLQDQLVAIKKENHRDPIAASKPVSPIVGRVLSGMSVSNNGGPAPSGAANDPGKPVSAVQPGARRSWW